MNTYPNPAEQTFPSITSSTASFGILTLSNAPRIAIAPRSVALNLDSFPKKEPIGVLAPETMYAAIIYR
jgi:hypothetical protein